MSKPAAPVAAEVVDMPVAWLKPNPRNTRTHSEEQVAQIARSIERFGFRNPILAGSDGVIDAGHGRHLACLLLGRETARVIIADGMTAEERRAFVIADNQLAANAGWDDELLKLELGELREADFDLSLIGFSGEQLAGILDVDLGSGADPDETPEPPKVAASRLGDVWLLGNHRIMCGDSVSHADVKILLDGAVPDIANCDPPYGISVVKGGNVGGAKAFGKAAGRVHGRAKNAIIEPGVYAPIIGDDTIDTAVKSYGVLCDVGVPVICLWGGNYFANALPNSRCWLAWDKQNTGTFADAELAWTNQDKVVKLFTHQWSGLIKASERGERRVHPTQKPVALAEWVIETLAPKAESVVDLFLGSASTMIACEQRKIVCFGMEMSPDYIDVAILRWQKFTGKEATLAATGQTFADVRAVRLEGVAA